MREMSIVQRHELPDINPAWLAATLGMVALIASAYTLGGTLPARLWWTAVVQPDVDDVRQLLFRYSLLPRVVVAMMAGGALGLAGAVFQRVLHNPLAEPTTLGVSSGAAVALLVATLWAPSFLEWGSEPIALAGATLAGGLVFGLSWKSALSPLSLILAGLVVSLYCGALSSFAVLFHFDRLTSIFMWGTGVLNQNDWRVVHYLLPRLLIVGLAIALLSRQLDLVAIGDEGARGLGLRPEYARLVMLGLGILLSAFVVSAVGMIGFIGLAAPAIARLSGARRVRDVMIWSFTLGAILLWLTDQLVQLLGAVIGEVPTGTATALLGAPVLLWLLSIDRSRTSIRQECSEEIVGRRGLGTLIVILCGLVGSVVLATIVGQNGHGWHISGPQELSTLLQWRLPRIAGAFAAGAMLAGAGMLMQRLTANPMASPEVLGVSSAAGLGVLFAIVMGGNAGVPGQIIAAAGGSLAVLLLMLGIGRRVAFAPDRMLLAGIAIGTIFSAVVSFAIASGDPRMQGLVGWMAGSTYYLNETDAILSCSIAGLLIPVAALFGRWLTVLPLGEEVSRSLGLNLVQSRFALTVVAAILTASATLIVGPFSFVGLMAPHMSRMIGMPNATMQLVGAALIGGLMMVVADFAGRNLLFPYQIPAGLLAIFIGGAYLMWLMRR